MSFPNIPDVNPEITITRTDVINLLLASIAFEELGLAHLINAEAEKIQAVLGTLPAPGTNVPATTINDLLNINKSVRKTLQDIIKKEMLLQFKLENVLEIPEQPTPPAPNPSIDIEKLVSADGGITWHDADAPPGLIVPQQTTPILIRFILTNNGDVTLTNVVVTDTVYGLIGTIPSLASGGVFEWVIPVPWQLGEHSNIATAIGTYEGVVYSDSDPVYYLGV